MAEFFKSPFRQIIKSKIPGQLPGCQFLNYEVVLSDGKREISGLYTQHEKSNVNDVLNLCELLSKAPAPETIEIRNLTLKGKKAYSIMFRFKNSVLKGSYSGSAAL